MRPNLASTVAIAITVNLFFWTALPSRADDIDGMAFAEALSSKVQDAVNSVGKDETSVRRRQAMDEANRKLTEEVANAVLTFRFTIKDVVKSSSRKGDSKRATGKCEKGGADEYLIRLEPSGENDSKKLLFIRSVAVQMIATDAADIRVGDIIDLSGKAKLVIGERISVPFAKLDGLGEQKSGQTRMGTVSYLVSASDRGVRGASSIVHIVRVNDRPSSYWLCLDPCAFGLVRAEKK